VEGYCNLDNYFPFLAALWKKLATQPSQDTSSLLPPEKNKAKKAPFL